MSNKKGLTAKESIEYQKRVNLIRNKYQYDQTAFQKAILKIKNDIINERDDSFTDTKEIEERKVIEIIKNLPDISQTNLVPFPNILAKTSVFAPRKKNLPVEEKHTQGRWIQLNTPPHYDLFYNGPLLTMEEQDLYMLLVKKAGGSDGDDYIKISRYQLLKELGYEYCSQHQYKWLYQAMNRLIQSNIKIVLKNDIIKHIMENTDNKINEITLHLLEEFAFDGEVYSFRINKNSLFLYSNKAFAWNNLDVKKIVQNTKKAGITAWIYSFILSESKGTHSYKIETIYDYLGSNKKIADFRKDIENSFNIMLEMNIISNFNIKENKFIQWERI
jgi:hypothetical protein